jgi:quinoprotein glucose dehydrogenase
VGVTDRLSHDALKQVIKGGRGLMPAFSLLSDEEFDALQAYLANPELALTRGPDLTTGRPEGPLRYQSGWNHIVDSRGVPVIKPPWFRLTAYDMQSGDIRWQVPVGEVPHLAEKGIENTGAANWVRGGPAITAGGLIFQPAGETLWAYDSEDGALLWRAPLPGVGEGVPAVYEVDGRQFLVVSATAGGFGQPPPTSSRSPGYLAYALPQAP